MIDVGGTIAPKSDQLNADDLIAGPKTIRVTSVSVVGGDQPVHIHFDGDGGKPYKPGKSMRRVLVSLWGADGSQYVGRSMTLYCDSSVQFGGVAVGGIRISHMSDIRAPVTLALTVKKAQRKPFTVRPLEVSAAPASISDVLRKIGAADSVDALAEAAKTALLLTDQQDKAAARRAYSERKAELGKRETADAGASADPQAMTDEAWGASATGEAAK